MKVEMICKDCGKGFIGGWNARYCPACKKERRKQRQRSEKYCKKCGKDISGTTAKKLCPECKKEKLIETSRNNYAQQKADLTFTAETSRKKLKGSSLSDAVALVESYNRIHGTNYSYGQAARRGII